MMDIMIAAAVTSYYSSEEKILTDALQRALKEQGHRVDTFFLPVADDLLSLPEQIVMMGLLDVGAQAELLITIGYPAFAVPHRRKAVCLLSLVPELYEGWDTEYGALDSPQYASLRDALHGAENTLLKEAGHIFCGSELLKRDINQRYGLNAETICFPCLYPFDESDETPLGTEYILCETSLHPALRTDMLLEAVKSSKAGWKLVLSIPEAYETYMKGLFERIEKLELKDRVVVCKNFMSRKLLKNAAGLAAIPYQTRKMPFAGLAALENGTPVITMHDSGCLNEFVLHEKNGLVLQPDAVALAKALDALALGGRRFKKAEKAAEAGSMEKIAQRLVNI